MNIPSLHPAIDPALLDRFEPITLDRMDSIRLMNRIDTKYVTDTLTLNAVLNDAANHGYMAFESGGELVHSYDSIYFDTPNLRMFTEHRRGKLVREKIRTRMYLGSGLCFLEVKKKDNHSRTRKKRIELPQTDFRDFRDNSTACGWLTSHSDSAGDEVMPSVETLFDRITLVNSRMTERLTIDTSVTFRNLRNGSVASLGAAVIIELKQDGKTGSKMKDILLDHRVKPMRISKYCIGTVLTDSNAAQGRFKAKVRLIDKLNKNHYIKCYNPVLLKPL